MEIATTQAVLFDYSQLDTGIQSKIQTLAGDVRTLIQRSAQGIIEIGRKLQEAKDQINNTAQFEAWLKGEFDWSLRSAYNFINVFQQFGNPDFKIENVAPSALYYLAEHSVPQAAKQVTKELANKGVKVTKTVAKAVTRQAKQKAQPVQEAIEMPPQEETADEEVEEAAPDVEAVSTDNPVIEAELVESDTPEQIRSEAIAPIVEATSFATVAKVPVQWELEAVLISLNFLPGTTGTRNVIAQIKVGEHLPITRLMTDADLRFDCIDLSNLVADAQAELVRAVAEKAAATAKSAKVDAASVKAIAKKPTPKKGKK